MTPTTTQLPATIRSTRSSSRPGFSLRSTRGSVAIVRWAKERGVDVTAEVTPHHLILTEELARTYPPGYQGDPTRETERRPGTD